jgi:hypothetical protein
MHNIEILTEAFKNTFEEKEIIYNKSFKFFINKEFKEIYLFDFNEANLEKKLNYQFNENDDNAYYYFFSNILLQQ